MTASNLCAVCGDHPRSVVLCHRVCGYICVGHCADCAYLRGIDYHCTWTGEPEGTKLNCREVRKVVKLLRTQSTEYIHAYYDRAVRGMTNHMVPQIDRDKLPYYWVRVKAAKQVLEERSGKENEGDL